MNGKKEKWGKRRMRAAGAQIVKEEGYMSKTGSQREEKEI